MSKTIDQVVRLRMALATSGEHNIDTWAAESTQNTYAGMYRQQLSFHKRHESRS
jgi:hypothetical protein